MLSSHLDVLRSRTNLVVPLWFDIVDLLVVVELLTNICKVLFHEVNILIIVLHIDSWVSD